MVRETGSTLAEEGVEHGIETALFRVVREIGASFEDNGVEHGMVVVVVLVVASFLTHMFILQTVS